MTIAEIIALPIEERQVKLIDIISSKKRSYGMFSNKGNKKVESVIKKCIKKVVNPKAIRKEEFEKFVALQIEKVEANSDFSEIGDTAVREVIYFWLEKAIEVAGYEWAKDFQYDN